jgi:hypothetical protein
MGIRIEDTIVVGYTPATTAAAAAPNGPQEPPQQQEDHQASAVLVETNDVGKSWVLTAAIPKEVDDIVAIVGSGA